MVNVRPLVTALVVLALVGATAPLASTQAATLDQGVTIQPADGPNGAYATTGDDDTVSLRANVRELVAALLEITTAEPTVSEPVTADASESRGDDPALDYDFDDGTLAIDAGPRCLTPTCDARAKSPSPRLQNDPWTTRITT